MKCDPQPIGNNIERGFDELSTDLSNLSSSFQLSIWYLSYNHCTN